MIRDKQSKVVVRPSSMVFISVFLLLTAATVVAHAGDQDGLGGYKMQLKQRYSDPNGTWSGGDNMVVDDPKLGGSSYTPKVLAAETPVPRWSINIWYYRDAFLFWLR